MPRIKAVPMMYRGVLFRSVLEADWAATLDSIGMPWWSYEPDPYEMPSGERYRPDFWLSDQRVWLEVKGPREERMHKVVEFAQAVTADAITAAGYSPTDAPPDERCWSIVAATDPKSPFVVVGRAAEAGQAVLAGVLGHPACFLRCRDCDLFSFALDVQSPCRACAGWATELACVPFVRAPRRSGGC